MAATAYEQALREIVDGGTEMARIAGEPAAASEDWPAKLARQQTLWLLLRKVGDACGVLEDIYKAEAPPHCELRVRAESRTKRCKPGLIEGMTMEDPGWLALAAKDGHVLEIHLHETEWCHEAAARFERACSTSAQEQLAALLAGGAGE